MRTAGLIGGIAPESTIQYYRQIVGDYRDRKQDGSYPSIIINSIDMTKMLDLIGADRLEDVTEYLLEEVCKLGRAGADFGALASNTPHVVFEALQGRSPIPLISVVRAACDAAQVQGLKRVCLFGTRFTMQGRFYSEVFAPAGIMVVTPEADDQAYIHEKYMSELVNGIFLPETRATLLTIVRHFRMREDIDGLILGGTELPLILPAPEYEGIPCLDTTKLHARQIAAELLRS